MNVTKTLEEISIEEQELFISGVEKSQAWQQHRRGEREEKVWWI